MSINGMNGRPLTADAAESAADLQTVFLLCRTILRHAWDPYVDNSLGRPSFGSRLSVICIRCGTRRHFLIDGRGTVASRRYEYPDGYKLSRDVTPEEMRVELLGREEALVRGSDGVLRIKPMKRAPKARPARTTPPPKTPAKTLARRGGHRSKVLA